MSNHRAMLKPKDVKFKRINKTKAKSLEELRDKLKCDQPPESISSDEISSAVQESLNETSKTSSPNRLAIVRGFMERRASFDLDSLNETTMT